MSLSAPNVSHLPFNVLRQSERAKLRTAGSAAAGGGELTAAHRTINTFNFNLLPAVCSARICKQSALTSCFQNYGILGSLGNSNGANAEAARKIFTGAFSPGTGF